MRKLLLTTAILCTASTAHAESWNVDKTHSTLTFEATQAGDTIKGGFKNFTSEIDFSEAAPEKGHIHVTVDIASVTADTKDRTESLPTDDWFATTKFPQAEFTSTAISKTGPHHYEATGKLTIHGVTKEITLPFTLTPQGAATLATGELVIKRNDYGIGSGQWASDKWIGYPVKIQYSILATPKN